jgi:catechol 2,3-dioxygenase-like lactoylglutathione lyase family enzyme
VVGQTLPIEAPPNNPRQIRVRWDLVELGYIRAPDPTPPRQSTGSPLDAIPVHSPTPTVRVYTQYADSPARADGSADGGSTLRTEPPTITYDPSDFEPDPAIDDDHMPPPPVVEEPTRPVPEGPPTWMPSIFAPKELTAAPAPTPAPRDEILAPSWEVEPPTQRVPDPEPGPVVDPDASRFGPANGDGPLRGRPLPEDAEEVSIRFFNGGRNEQDMPAMGGMLIVSDLDRSLRFYSDLLGFTIVYASSGNAVVEYGGARILLQHMADFSEIDRRVGHLHIEVPDLDLAFADLVAKGVQFSHRPRMASRGDKIELWKATFRDPDGHGIALTQWREREDD